MTAGRGSADGAVSRPARRAAPSRDTSSSLRRCSSAVRRLPTTEVAKPHCVPSASRSSADHARGLRDPRLELGPRLEAAGVLVVTSPSTTSLSVGHARQRVEAARALVVVLEQQPLRRDPRRRSAPRSRRRRPRPASASPGCRGRGGSRRSRRGAGGDHGVVELDAVGEPALERPAALPRRSAASAGRSAAGSAARRAARSSQPSRRARGPRRRGSRRRRP